MTAEITDDGGQEYKLTPPSAAVCCGVTAMGGCGAAIMSDQMPDCLGRGLKSHGVVTNYCPAETAYVPGTGFVQRAQPQ